ncbi:MAG: SpaH/EbpB family LPXTG-anchored major pilin [Lawsonibacter sp.]|nr:SpaH/EbpB family LPXTG-anchored major pilin [Lawsonibacter sp.]
MKRTKKLFSLALAFIMAMALMTPAFAAEEGTLTGGSITINDAVPGQTYKAYQILYLESYNATSNAYAYKANSAWETWLKTQTSYVSFDAQGYVTWVENADAAAFAKLAQVEAAKMTADATATAPAAAEGKTYSTVTFSDLKLGYYLVDTTLGTLCSLDTTNPNVVMEEKNEVPTNVKTVEEDSTGNYGEKNDADIGQTVNFKSTITAQAGAENYVFHDTMSAGLTYTGVTGITLNGTTVDASNYTITAPAADGDTFDVTFTQAFCDTLKANDQIVISYTATLNENAVIAGEGNPNTSWLDYGDSTNTKHTPDSTTTTYTWKVDVLKYTMVDKTETALAGATFTLSKNADGSNPIALVKVQDNLYRVAKTGETGTVTEITTDATGKFTIQGLDADTYYLTETKAPDGYNKLAGPVTIVIGANGVVNGTTDAPQGVGEVKVLNQTGAELPSTGGMGTTIFYVLGGVLMAGAAILLVTKKKMSNEQ